ncbi:nucleoside triphosphate pyrophosphohydrolase family protein [Chengkuizengella sediminis]|uniref:nucleoside triphosphate pyrophosphohydrolase family protein n=1 Tax=Chengkuizengella sediminis TaxID=1885917 RepID=UPI00138985CF|nr:nucleoside triphosphate pyrophosphohydrolase family protein [Chengkuizengella sediminis]NDI35587.1 nucleoside triphosphate pyrophosphohydrolase family protein [Chengkuizengella sediminis]
MDFNEYQMKAMRTAAGSDSEKLLLNTALGLCGESGEVADHLKKHIFQGHELDRKKLEKELGDVLWYLAAGAEALGISLEEIAKGNITKLEKRYPNGFECEKSINRVE